MDDISSIRDLVNLWPLRSALADDINAAAGFRLVTTAQVHKWAEKQSVPAKYHHFLILAGQRRSYLVTAEMMVRLHAAGTPGLSQVAEDAV